MRRHVVTLALLLAMGCGESSESPAPVLSLVPAAMQTAGPSANADDHTRCLIAGASVEATVHAQRSTVTIILVAFAATPGASPSFLVRWGGRQVGQETVRTARAEAFVYRVDADRGDRVLRVEVPTASPGVLCLNQVVVTQP